MVSLWCNAEYDVVQCQMWCEIAMWNDCVVHVENGGVMQDVKCGCGIWSDLKWCGVTLDMVV